MPIGANLGIQFDTTVLPNPSRNTYAFTAGGQPAATPLGGVDAYHGQTLNGNPIDLGQLDGYSGAYSISVISLPKSIYFGLTDGGVPLPVLKNLDFSPIPVSHYAHYGISMASDLTVEKSPYNHINLTVIEIPSYDYNTFEFSFVDNQNVTWYGSTVDFDLTVDRRNITHFNMSMDAASRPLNIVEFEFDQIELHGAAFGSSIQVELTAPYNRLNNNLGIRLGTNTDQVNFNPITSKTGFDFTDALTALPPEFELNGIQFGSAYDSILIHSDRVVGTFGSNTPDFNLLACTASNDFDLLPCDISLTVTGKNLTYDFSICPNDSNPALNSDGHDFHFNDDFLTYACEQLIFNAYHGGSGATNLAKDIEFTDVLQRGGEHALLFDLSAYRQLVPNAYGGSYGNTDFSIYPAALMEPNVQHGSYGDLELFTIVHFYDVDAQGGAYSDLDFTVPKGTAFIIDGVQEGSNANIEIATLPVLFVDPMHSGAYGDADLKDYPSIELDINAYHGSYSVQDTFLVFKTFDPVSYHGGYGDIDLTDVPSEGIGVVDTYHGSDTNCDLAYTPTLFALGYHGANGVAELSYTTTFDGDAYSGEYAELDFTRVLAPEFIVTPYHGSNTVCEMNVTKALFTRNYSGAVFIASMETAPGEEIQIDAYHGGFGEGYELDEHDWVMHGYMGADGVADVAVTLNLSAELYHGSNTEIPEFNYDYVSFDVDARFGAYSNLDLAVPQGEALLANAYGGSALEVTTSILEYAILGLKPINAGVAMYDGWGGVGGLNHCEACEEDTIIRLGYDVLGVTDKLNIEFSDTGDRPWNTCSTDFQVFDWDLAINQRFEFDCYGGESGHLDIPLTVTGFAPDIPLERLYVTEYFAIIDRDLFEVEFSDGSNQIIHVGAPAYAAFAGPTFDVDLTTTYFGLYHQDSNITVDMATVEHAWKFVFSGMGVGSNVYVNLEPVHDVDFCKGYIQPGGEAVVFEFGASESTDCANYWASHGSTIEPLILEIIQAIPPGVQYNGAYVPRHDLVFQSVWTLYARHNTNMYVQLYDEARPEQDAYHGSVLSVTFEDHPTLGTGGEFMAFDELIVPGPGIQWITEESICLPNQFVPLTSSGDIDVAALLPDENGVTHYPQIAVEFKPFVTSLQARCIAFSDIEE